MNTMASLEPPFLKMLCQGFPSILKFYLILFDMFLRLVSFNLTGSLHAHFGFQFSVFTDFLSVWKRGLCFLHLLFICFVLSRCAGFCSSLLYYTVSLRSPFVFRRDRKGVDLDWRGGGQKLGWKTICKEHYLGKNIFKKKGKESLTFHNWIYTNNFMLPVSPVKGVFALEIHLIKARTEWLVWSCLQTAQERTVTWSVV